MRKIINLGVTGIICAALLAGCAGNDQKASSQASSSSSSEETSSESSSTSADSGSDTLEFKMPDKTSDGIELTDGDYDPKKNLTLENYIGMKLEKQVTKVTEQDVDDYMLSVFPAEVLEDPDAKVQDGDTVDVAYDGKINGESFDGGSSDSYYLVIGSGQFIEGFEEALIGMKASEEKDIELKFPDDYWDTEVAGSPVTFHVKINEIRRVPEITDELVKERTEGEVATYEEFREFAREELAVMNEKSSEQMLRESAWSNIYDTAKFKALPKDKVQTGAETYQQQMETEAEYYQMTVGEYIQETGMTEEDYNNMLLDYGVTIAKSEIIISYIWDKEGLKEDEVYDEIYQELLDMYGLDEETAAESIGETTITRYCRMTRMLQYVVDHAKITEVEVDEISG